MEITFRDCINITPENGFEESFLNEYCKDGLSVRIHKDTDLSVGCVSLCKKMESDKG